MCDGVVSTPDAEQDDLVLDLEVGEKEKWGITGVAGGHCCHIPLAIGGWWSGFDALTAFNTSYFSLFVDQVHQITSADAGEIVVCKRRFQIVDILFRSGDIRDRSAK